MRRQSAFTLVEILVALAIVAVVGTLVTVTFNNIRRQALFTIAADMEKQLNDTLEMWRSNGGTMGNNVFTSDLLDMFASNVRYNLDPNGPRRLVDGAASSLVRMSISSKAETTSKLGGIPRRGCRIDDEFYVVYMNGQGVNRFGVAPLINEQIPIYYPGVNDQSRVGNILRQAEGQTEVMVETRVLPSYELSPLDKVIAAGNGLNTISNLIESGGMFVSYAPATLDLGIYSTQDWRIIEVFTKTGTIAESAVDANHKSFWAGPASAVDAKWAQMQAALR